MAPPEVSRRQALTLLGSAALVAVAAACGGSSGSDASRRGPRSGSSSAAAADSAGAAGSAGSSGSATTASCVLTPEMTEGPFYIDGEAVRRDITEGKPGVPLRLDLTVVDADTCKAIPGAAVEVWHADATGNYSGFGRTTSNSTFLRGVQHAGDDGAVTFQTVYPGWYPGRAVHIHLEAHNGGDTVHTTQLFFDENVSDAVFTTSPYDSRSGDRTLNTEDDIYRGGGAASTLELAKDGDGFVGTLTLGIRDTV